MDAAQRVGQAVAGGAGCDVIGVQGTCLLYTSDDQPAVAAGLSDLSGGDDVAGADLVDEALALGVDQHSAVAAQTLGDQGSGCLLYTSRCV